MDRGVLASMVLVLLGVLLVVSAPPDPQYSVSVSGPTDAPEGEDVVPFEELSEENRTLFLDAFEDEERFSEEPNVQQIYVRYEGDTYEMSSWAHEGPVLSLLMPPLGGLFVLFGCLVALYSYRYRS